MHDEPITEYPGRPGAIQVANARLLQD